MASDLLLDANLSKAYYIAKKDQFFGTYTVEGKSDKLRGSLQRTSNGYRGDLYIEAASFESGNFLRDKHVREYLHARKYRQISCSYDIRNNEATALLKVNGVSRRVVFPVVVERTDRYLLIEGNVSVKYSDFGIETPSNIILKAHDDLTIGARLYFDLNRE